MKISRTQLEFRRSGMMGDRRQGKQNMGKEKGQENIHYDTVYTYLLGLFINLSVLNGRCICLTSDLCGVGLELALRISEIDGIKDPSIKYRKTGLERPERGLQ